MNRFQDGKKLNRHRKNIYNNTWNRMALREKTK